MSWNWNVAAKPEYATAKIAVWWDMQDCPIPEGYDARRVRSSIEGEFKKLGYSGPVSITAYEDHKQTPVHVLRGLSSTGVVVAHTVPKCRCARMFSDMLEWRVDNPPPATMMLISDQLKDVFELDLVRLQQQKTYNFCLAYSVRSPYMTYLHTTADWLWKRLLDSSSSTSETTSCCSELFSCTMCSFDFQSLKLFQKHLSSKDHAVQEAMYPVYEESLDTVTRSWGRNYPAKRDYATAQIAVWWDMHDCPIPKGCAVTSLLPGLQGAFKSLGYNGPVSINAYGDLNQTPDHLLQELSSIGVAVSHTHCSVTTRVILQDMEVWRSQNPPPATMMLISDSPDEEILAKRQQKSTYTFFLAYSFRPLKTSLLVTSAEWLWDSFFTVSETRGTQVVQKCSERSESTGMFYCKLYCSCECKDIKCLREHLSSVNHTKEEARIDKASQWPRRIRGHAWKLEKYPDTNWPRQTFPRGFRDFEDKMETGENTKSGPQKNSSETELEGGKEPTGNRTRSRAWPHFTKMKSGLKAVCKHCSTPITIQTKGVATTTAMLNHMKRCKKLAMATEGSENKGKHGKQSTLVCNKGDKNGTDGAPSFHSYNKEDCRRALVRMVIKDELPFRFVEREGFQEFVRMLQPRFVIPSRRTVTRDCVALFKEEREQLSQWFKNFSGSVSLTTDTWSSCQNLNYMCLTAHFIDSDWKLHKKILNFCQISSHSGEMIGRTVEKCLLFWGIDKVFTITVDNASSNDLGVRYMRDSLRSREGCVLDGEFLHMRCGAHILGLVVKEGLKDVEVAISRIRMAVRYVKSSPSRLLKFKECLTQLKLPTNCGICLDVETRWNSTFLMLNSALKVRKAFDLLELKDKAYRVEMAANLPKNVDWSYAEGLVPFLQSFYETTVKISGSLYITANVYMKEIFGLSLLIIKMGMDDVESIRDMSVKMRGKFDKYWGNFDNINMIIFVATVLDPRYKLQWVSWLISEIYSPEDAAYLLSKIKDALEQMFNHYKTIIHGSSVSFGKQDDDAAEVRVQKIGKIGSWMTSMYKKHKESKGHVQPESELEKYLTDDCEDEEDEDFKILYWWKTTGSKYKILSLMARDVLAVPVSTVASESAFSAGGRVLDAFRSSLNPGVVEALICTQDWIRRENQTLLVEETMEDIIALESEISSDPVIIDE